MRILVAAPDDPYSRVNFIEGFRSWGHEVDHFDFTHRSPEAIQGLPRGRYDLLFHVLVNGEGESWGSCDFAGTTLMWASDDDWRLPLSLEKVGHYDIGTTNDPNALPIYRSHGHGHVVHVQYGYNPDVYQAENTQKLYDVSFVGQAYAGRPDVVKYLLDKGIDIKLWGQGWERYPEFKGIYGGTLPQASMLQVQRQTKISLGLNFCAGGPEAGRAPQIKGRIFEVGALGSFQLNYRDGRLRRYFEEDEVALWSDPADLLDSIRYYLKYEDEREAIALKAQKRCELEHTWAARFKKIFQKIEESPCPA